VALDAIESLDTSTQEAVIASVQTFMQSYFNDVNSQLLSVHKELLTLQLKVAEHLEGYTPS